MTAGLEKVFSPNPAVGFLAHARRFGDAMADGKILAPAKTLAEMGRVVFNDYVDATLAGGVRGRGGDHGGLRRDPLLQGARQSEEHDA